MRKTLALADLRRTFVRIGFKPRLMRDLVKSISAEGLTDIDAGVSRFLLDERQLAGWHALLQPHDLFERAVLVTIAQGRPPMGRETLAALARLPGRARRWPRCAAIERLRRAGLVAKGASSGTTIDDPLFAEYLRGLSIETLT
jgi:hypothetical protein